MSYRKNRLKIALVAHGIHFRGGMERCFAELARALCRSHDVHLFTSAVGDVPLDQLTVHSIPVLPKPLGIKFLQFYGRSSRLLHAQEFDIVHTIGGITARQNIVTAQYCQSAWGEVIQRGSAAEGLTVYHRLMWRLTGFFEKQAVNCPRTKLVHANSQRTKDDLHRFYGTPMQKIEVIHNAVDPNRFTPDNQIHRAAIRQRYGIRDNALLFLFVGEYRRKGLANVIRALGLLQSPQVHLLAVGQGDHAQYRNLAAQVGVQNQVTLAEPATDIECLYAASDAFVFPTFYEPFGMVITEAMASGLPVITSRRAGAAELIEEGHTGLLLNDPDDVGELAALMERILSDRALRCGLGTNARPRVCGHRWESMATQTLDLYRQVLQLEAA